MQRRYVNANRSSASRSYRKRLQKRLLHHKQQLHELEQAKKSAASKVRVYYQSDNFYKMIIGLKIYMLYYLGIFA